MQKVFNITLFNDICKSILHGLNTGSGSSLENMLRVVIVSIRYLKNNRESHCWNLEKRKEKGEYFTDLQVENSIV